MHFLDSFCSITISKNGDTYTAQSLPRFYNSVSRVSVRVKSSEIMNFEITLTPSFDDAIWILSSGLLGVSVSKKDEKPQSSGVNVSAKSTSTNAVASTPPSDKTLVSQATSGMTQIKIKLMRPGEKLHTNKPFETAEYSGVIYQPEVNISGADVSIILKGYAYSSMSAGPKFNVHIENGKQTLLEVIKEILEFMDYDPSPEFLDEKVESKLNGMKAPSRNGRETLLDTIKWACGLVSCGFVENTKSSEGKSKLSFYDKDFSTYKAKEPKYKLVQWRQVEPEKGTIPLLDFKMDSAMLLFLQGSAFGTYKTIIDPETKMAKDDERTDEQAAVDKKSTSLMQTSPTSKKKAGRFVSTLDAVSEEETKKADTEAKAGIAKYQKFSFTIPGVPDLFVMDQVNLSIGNVAAFQGVCLVHGVSHTMDAGGWVTDLEAFMVKSLDDGANKNQPEAQEVAASSGNTKLAQGLA